MASHPSSRKSPHHSWQWCVPFGVLSVGGVLTALVVMFVAEMRELQKETHRRHTAELTLHRLTEQVENCATLTRNAAGVIVNDWETARDAFNRYVGRLSSSELHAGFRFMGYVMRISPGEEDLLVKWAQSRVSPNFHLRSDAAQGSRYTVLFVGPQNAESERSLGLDPWNLNFRHRALNLARDSGEPVLCAHLAGRFPGNQTEAGFVIYAPVYETGGIPADVTQRQANIRGYTYILFNAQEFFRTISRDLAAGQYGLEIYDGEGISGRKSLFSSPLPEGFVSENELIQSFSVAGQTWTLRLLAGPEAGAALSSFFVWGVAGVGLVVTLLLAVGSYRLRSAQIHAELRAEEALEAEESARTAMRAKDDFLAMLSHELRTPLTPVLAAISGLQSDPRLPSALKGSLIVARRNAEQEIRLINDLLDFTRAAHGKLHLDSHWLDLHPLMQECAEDISELRQRSLHLEIFWMAEQSGVLGDRPRLVQLFSNLLRNAAKFTPPGGLIRVHAHNDFGADGEPWLVVSVEDTGVGIDPAKLEQIFLPFEQGGTDVTRRYGGLGLGLPICRNIVELHGGAISAASAGFGRGARFTVRLPCVVCPADAQPEPEVVPTRTTSPQHLLLVEDHADTASILSNLIQRLGHRVTYAGSVTEALSTAALLQGARHSAPVGHSAITMVISDIGLPDGSGLELMRELSSRYGLKGIALSGFGGDDDRRASLAAGFMEHLVKPVAFEDLRQILGDLELRQGSLTSL